MKIYLASKSPRRKQLLEQIGIAFELLLFDIPEAIATNETPEQYSKRITKEKLITAWSKILTENHLVMPVLCADTEVVFNQAILGKPRDYQDAFSMLRSLSGEKHQVITSLGLRYYQYQKIKTIKTTVYFATMSDEDIHDYLALGDYQDKAGAYGIQSSIGQFINKINGCFYSVMGLPLHTVRELLDEYKLEFKNECEPEA